MHILLALLIGGLLVVSGYQLHSVQVTSPFGSQVNQAMHQGHSCGSQSCGNKEMTYAVTITDEKTFLEEMIPHHLEAVATSQIIQVATNDVELKQFAQDVIDAQSAEITLMKTWLNDWYGDSSDGNPSYLPMMADLQEYQDSEQDRVYIEGMIHHHLGAIDMAEQVLRLNPQPETRQLAENILRTQRTEVALLQSWLKTKYPAAETESSMHHMMMGH